MERQPDEPAARATRRRSRQPLRRHRAPARAAAHAAATEQRAIAAPVPESPSARRTLHPRLLIWSFTFFSSARIVAYLPTIWAIHASGDSSQHSLLTWLTWLGKT